MLNFEIETLSLIRILATQTKCCTLLFTGFPQFFNYYKDYTMNQNKVLKNVLTFAVLFILILVTL